MDQKLSRAVGVLDALDSYFRSLEEYIKDTDRSKFTQLELGLESCRKFKRRFEAIKMDDDGMFQAVHLQLSTQKLLSQLYELLDFELPVGEEISKTRAYKLSEVFNKITSIYRTYIKDVAAESSEIVYTAAKTVKTRDPLLLQSLWQKWPNSIDLYTLLQTELLNQGYRDKNPTLVQKVFEIIESDKRFILGEQTWLSPFITFNCVPWTMSKTPVDWKTLIDSLADPKITGQSPSEIDGAIIINREQLSGMIHLLPVAMAWGAGVTESDISQTLMPIKGAPWNWNITVNDSNDTERYYIFESFGSDQWRLLVPWKFAKSAIPKDLLIHKIKEHAFGRPNAYHELLETPLRNKLSRRVAIITQEEAREKDVSLSVLRVTDLLLTEIKSLKGDTLKRVESNKLDKIFETSVLDELSKHDLHLLDAVLYWTDWSRKAFRRELDSAIDIAHRESPLSAWDVVVQARVEKCIHHAVESQLRKAENIFQDLFNKQHKLDEVATHTKKID